MSLARFVFVLSVCAVPALAGTDAAAQRASESVLPSMCSRAYVRIAVAGERRTEGACQPAGGDSLLLARRGSVRSVAVLDIDTLWTRESKVGQGILIGGLAGAAALTTLGIVFVNGMCDAASCSDDYPGAIFGGILVGGGIGSLIGGVIGRVASGWQRRYP